MGMWKPSKLSNYIICLLWLFTFHVMTSIPSQEMHHNCDSFPHILVFVAVSKKSPLTKVRATSGWLAGLFLVFIFLSHMMVSLGLGGRWLSHAQQTTQQSREIEIVSTERLSVTRQQDLTGYIIYNYTNLHNVFLIPFWYWKDRRTGIQKTLQVTHVDSKPGKSTYNQNCRSRIMQIRGETGNCILKDTHKRQEFGTIWLGRQYFRVAEFFRHCGKALPWWLCRCSTCSSESFAMLFTRLEQGWSTFSAACDCDKLARPWQTGVWHAAINAFQMHDRLSWNMCMTGWYW